MLKPKQVKPIDVREILTIFKKRKWMIIVPVIIISIIAYVGTYFIPPKFESSTIVFIDKPSNVSSELEHILGGTNRRETREERYSKQLAIETELTSYGYMVRLIQDLDLDDDPEISREAAIKRETNPDVSLEQIKFNLLVAKLKDQISVRFQGADQIVIRVESEYAAQTRDIANHLTEILEEEKAKYEMQKVLDDQRFNDIQLQKREEYYQIAIDSLNDARARLTKLQLPENIASEMNRLDILSTIDKLEIDISDMRQERNVLKSQLKEFNLEKTRFKFSDTIIELRTTIDGFVSSYVNLMEKYTWNDQNIININIRLNDNNRLLENVIRNSIDEQFASLPENQRDLLKRNFIVKENIDILNSKTNRLQQSLSKINDRINLIPRLESEISELTNKVEDSRSLRNAFKAEETTVGILSERAKERTTYKVIEPAKLPLEPFWPNKRNILIIGIALGLVLGGAFIFLFELLDNSFKQVEDVEEELGIPVIATIPKIEKFQINR